MHLRKILLLYALLVGLSIPSTLIGGTTDSTIVIRPVLTERAPRIPGFIPRHFAKRPRVALVLSGGGARGAAAIGVLQSLEEHNIPVDFIVGTSIGSIIGGLYACGYSTEELHRLLDTTDWDEIMSLNDDARRREMFLDQKLARDKSVLVLRFNGLEPVLPESFSTGQRMTNFLNVLTLQGLYHPEPSFDDLKIPFRAVTTDLVTGRRIVIDRGDLAEALRASMAIPLLFSSVRKDSMQLLDGGLVANLPVEVAVENGYDIIISVDVTSPLRPRSMLNAPWEIADQITTIMMYGAKMQAREKSDVVIIPPIGDHSSTDFEGLDSLIAAGRATTDSAIGKITSLMETRMEKMYGRDGDKDLHVREWRMVAAGAPVEFPAVVDSYRSRPRIAEADLRSLAGKISELGEFSDVTLHVDGPADSARVTIVVKRYPTVHAIDIKGASRVSADTIRTLLLPLIGKPLNVRLAENYLDEILGMYRRSGYAFAKVSEVRFDSAAGRATLEIEEGTIYYSTIVGTTKTRDWVIWRELPWKNGDVFRIQNASQAVANMYGTSLFEQVLISSRREGAQQGQNVVVINVRERNTELIRLGLRVDNDRNIQPSIDVRDENFLGAGAEIGFMTAFGPRNQSIVSEIRATRIFNSYFTFGLKGYYHIQDINVYTDVPTGDPRRFDRERVGEYKARRFGGSFSFGTQLERLGSVIAEGRIEQHSLRNSYSNEIADQKYRISSIRLGTKIDTRDQFPFPHDGVAINLFYESALMKIEESIGFTKFFVSFERSHPIASRHTLRPKIVLGVGDETLPLSEQFSLGGQDSFFGYPEDNARGRQLFVAGLEYQYLLPLRLFFDTYFKARYDLGSTWLTPDEIRLEDMEHGLGVTLAFDTPVGPAEFSLGRSFYLRKDLLQRPLSWGPLMFYFSIGTPLVSIGERR